MSSAVRWKSAIGYSVGIAAVTLLLLAVVEGIASIALFVHDATGSASIQLPRGQYTTHDTLLGWASRPQVDLPDAYGPGRWMRTEAHGFRNTEDVETTVPEGFRRVVCSGDSFTQGYGVTNEDAWCHQLSVLEPSLEAVNVGQSGYSLSQVYLSYMRDARALEHEVHFVSFVTVDFFRMASLLSNGYARPGLALSGDTLVPTNIPVPKRVIARMLEHRLAQPAASMRVVQLLQAVTQRTFGSSQRPSDEETMVVAGRIFATLARVNKDKGSQLVLVYLPTQGDYTGHASDWWRDRVGQFADAAAIPFIDLVNELQALDQGTVDSLFLQPGEVAYTGAAGHYNAKGNRWVAETLHRRLSGFPSVRGALASTDPGR
jgi:hypothetical protein